jgi:thymidylate synthase (FAD)
MTEVNTAKIVVEYIDHMGTDKTVVNSARVSFSKDTMHDEVLDQRDEKLIKYLAKHSHWSPFAHTSIQFKCTSPIFIARQLVKHQVGGVWNEVSRRYVSYDPDFFAPSAWRSAPKNAKQGSDTPLEADEQHLANNLLNDIHVRCLQTYKDLLNVGVCPEQARMVLPLSSMTQWYWTGSLMFWARVCKQRMDPHAQEEARDFAFAVAEHCKRLFPVSWDALLTN